MKNLKVKYKLLVLAVLMVSAMLCCAFFAVRGMSGIEEQAADTLTQELYGNYDEQIKMQVENAISMLEVYNSKYESGECTLEEAKQQAADMLRELRYGENGYFWADDTEGNCIVLLGNETEGTNRINSQDANGTYYMKDIIANGQQPEGGYSDYEFPKNGETTASPKRGYSKYYEPFGWWSAREIIPMRLQILWRQSRKSLMVLRRNGLHIWWSVRLYCWRLLLR